MTTWPILSVVTFLPIVGALLIYLVRGDDEAARRNARWIALWTTLITFAVSVLLVLRFDPNQTDFQFVEKSNWLAAGISYHMGVDGISLPFVILTTALMPFCIVASWKSVTDRLREYMMAFLILETLMVGTFSALDLVLFYLFFDGLTSLYLISGMFGLFQGGIVPSYAIIVREAMPAREAATRVGIVIFASVFGMSFGGWVSGVIFDATGSYAAAFANGLGWNALNLAIVVTLLILARRQHSLAA